MHSACQDDGIATGDGLVGRVEVRHYEHIHAASKKRDLLVAGCGFGESDLADDIAIGRDGELGEISHEVGVAVGEAVSEVDSIIVVLNKCVSYKGAQQ